MTAVSRHSVPFSEAVKVWVRVAALSFGGPAGQIAVMHRILVDEKRWIGDERFLHALNYCMLLPGPEAQQLAVYIGWLLHKTRGGLVAGTLFVLPGFIAILALSYLYVVLGHVPAIEGFFFGLKAAVLAIVVQAVARIGSRALRNNILRALAAAAFIAMSGRRSVSKFRLLHFAASLGCGHVFDLLMRRIYVPLAMMPFSQILGSRPKTRAWKRRVENGFSRIIGPAAWQLCVSQSPALANLVCASGA